VKTTCTLKKPGRDLSSRIGDKGEYQASKKEKALYLIPTEKDVKEEA